MSLEQRVNNLLNEAMNKLRSDLATTANLPSTNDMSYEVTANSATLSMPDWLDSLLRGLAPTPTGNADKDFIEGLKAWIVAKQIPFKNKEDLERLSEYYLWHLETFGKPPAYAGQSADIPTLNIEKFADEVNEKMVDIIMNDLLTFEY